MLRPALIVAAAAALGLGIAATIVSKPVPVEAAGESRQPVARGGRVLLTPSQVETAKKSKLWPGEVRSILDIDRPLRYGGFVWNDRGVPPGLLFIKVDLRGQLISVFRAGHEIGTAVILYGADEFQTPLGRYPILEKMRDHRSRTYDAPMPYSLRLTSDGVAIHGSDVRRGSATHGCIGIPLEFARKLFDVARDGNDVTIVG
jgi:lipoprotein-anchoring transpeptidase ErfK/SrfK